ncbi:GNAT family N-acetyltransferase [Saccharospirillum sp. HFRX-1]|uniref:GNAT family N-acetyltransferase n=1 Tax=unclassified Saccharospirillum TaxID=2633430 RepID=UPI003719B6A1
MSVVIREARLADAERLAELMPQLGYVIAPARLADKIADFSKSQSDAVFVAELDGNLVGFISCHLTPLFHQAGNSGRITSLLVEQSVRNKGIGRLLVTEAEAFFISQKCVKFEVTSGLQRSETHRFYQTLGYQADNFRFAKFYRD